MEDRKPTQHLEGLSPEAQKEKVRVAHEVLYEAGLRWIEAGPALLRDAEKHLAGALVTNARLDTELRSARAELTTLQQRFDALKAEYDCQKANWRREQDLRAAQASEPRQKVVLRNENEALQRRLDVVAYMLGRVTSGDAVPPALLDYALHVARGEA